MPQRTTRHYRTTEDCVDALIERVGKTIVIGIPLGLGKPVHFTNALYERAKADSTISLTIFTALTLEIPRVDSELARRFIEPITERVFGGCPELKYADDRQRGTVPANISIFEFYVPPGKLLSNSYAQQNYISSNYTHIARDMLDRGVNAIAQMVAYREEDGLSSYSLSCNPDVTLDLVRHMRALGAEGYPVEVIAEVNNNLPFMYGDAVVEENFFDSVITNSTYSTRLFGPPKTSVTTTDSLIGLYASTLIRDGGTLQVGIGSLGDALVYSLKLRQEENELYHDLLADFEITSRFGDAINRVGGTGQFNEGLFGATEMMIDGFLELMHCGVLKRNVYQDQHLQQLVNEGSLTESIPVTILEDLLTEGAISEVLSEEDIRYLQRFGILRDSLTVRDGVLTLSTGETVSADLSDELVRSKLRGELGTQLLGGTVLHGAFYLGCEAFYRRLRDLSEDERKRIRMTSVAGINQLYGNEVLDTLQRRTARFVNSALMATALGAIVSDGLEDGRILSGVGGQYNFVAMAHALADGRSILTLRSTRTSNQTVASNILWKYGHQTIPRHLRDFVITEYGIADLRGKTDAECIAEMIKITDSRFQAGLLREAKQARKISADYEIPHAFCENFPAMLQNKLGPYQKRDYFPEYPFGTDLTEIEINLRKVLSELRRKMAAPLSALALFARALIARASEKDLPYLERMALAKPGTIRERCYRRLLIVELRQMHSTEPKFS